MMRKLFVFVVTLGILVAVILPSYGAGPIVTAQGDTRAIVWESDPDTDGQLQLRTAAGVESALVQFPPGKGFNLARACGQDYWAAEGEQAAIYTGGLEGSVALYPLASGDPIMLGETRRMTCSGPLTFQFSPNGQRVGYIDFDPEAVDREYAFGELVLRETSAGTEQGRFDWANSFVLYDDGALMVRIFPDGKQNGVEADVTWWDGTGRRLLTTLEVVYPPETEDVDCTYSGSAVTRLGDAAYVLVTQECEAVTLRSWRLYSVPMAGGDAVEIVGGDPAGSTFSESFTVQLFPALDTSGVLMALPSGLARNTVSLYWVTREGTVTPVLEGQHILTDKFGDFLLEGRHFQLARDGSSVAFVTVTANGDQALWTLSLASAATTPVALEEEGAGQRIFQYGWAENNMLFYAAGSIESSSLHSATPDGSTQRLERGRFYRIAVSYTGDKVAAAEFFENPESLGEDLYKITLWESSGSVSIFAQGGEQQNELIPLAVQ